MIDKCDPKAGPSSSWGGGVRKSSHAAKCARSRMGARPRSQGAFIWERSVVTQPRRLFVANRGMIDGRRTAVLRSAARSFRWIDPTGRRMWNLPRSPLLRYGAAALLVAAALVL